MNKKLIFVVILAGLLVSNFVFASDNDNLIGEWINERTELIMFNNGSGSWYDVPITWRIVNNQLNITWRNALYIYDYSLSDSIINMVGVSANDRGTRYVYSKKFEGIPDNSSFVGTWFNTAAELIMLNDGTGSWYNASIIWKIENNILHITWKGDLYTYEFTLAPLTLIMVGVSSNDRARYIYTRK
ncbi:MAG: hypothetical protein FWD13_11470 [Treponema sp.]|nr:hypothetical protein [Treponema sp.]